MCRNSSHINGLMWRFYFKCQSPAYSILVRKVRHMQSQSQAPSRPILCPKRPSFHKSKRFRKGTRGFHRQCIHTKHCQKFSQNQRALSMKCRSNQTYISNHSSIRKHQNSTTKFSNREKHVPLAPNHCACIVGSKSTIHHSINNSFAESCRSCKLHAIIVWAPP